MTENPNSIIATNIYIYNCYNHLQNMNKRDINLENDHENDYFFTLH